MPDQTQKTWSRGDDKILFGIPQKRLYVALVIYLLVLIFITGVVVLYRYLVGETATPFGDFEIATIMVWGIAILTGIPLLFVTLFFTRNLDKEKRGIIIWIIFDLMLISQGILGVVKYSMSSQHDIPWVIFLFFVIIAGSFSAGFLFRGLRKKERIFTNKIQIFTKEN